MPAIIGEPGGRRRSPSGRLSGRGLGLALLILPFVGACQATGSSVYVDPAANLGRPASQQSALTAQQSGLPVDAQGQPNDEFDGRSWIDNRRSDARPPVRPPQQSREANRGRSQTIPLLHAPPSDGVELDPNMFGRAGR